MDRVAIILSVYNGKKFLETQLDSLLNQSYQNIDIFIHDDGSKDGSIDILTKYEKKYENIHIVPEKIGLGYPICFISLLSKVDGYKYYAFCDQDDMWKLDKIQDGVICLSKENRNQPLLYYTAVDYCDVELNHIRESRFAKGKKKIEQMNLQSMIVGGEAMGMTFIFNDVARKALLNANNFGSGTFKDWFLKLYCAACGKVYYNPKPSAKYRRHNEAVTNNVNPAGKLSRYTGQIREIFFSKNRFDDQKRIIKFIEAYEADNVLKDNIKIINLFSEPYVFSKRIKKFFWPRRFRTRILDEIGYRIAFILGRI